MTTLGWAEWGKFTASLSDKSGSDSSLFMPFVQQTRDHFTFVQTETQTILDDSLFHHEKRLIRTVDSKVSSFLGCCRCVTVLRETYVKCVLICQIRVSLPLCNMNKSYFLSFRPRCSKRLKACISVHCPLQKTTQCHCDKRLWGKTIARATHNTHTCETGSGGSQWQLWSQRPLQLQVNLILYRLTEMDLSNLCCWRGTKLNLNNSRAAPIFKLLLFWTEGREGLKKMARERFVCRRAAWENSARLNAFIHLVSFLWYTALVQTLVERGALVF